MTRASVSELKAKLSAYLARVKRGGEVSVTDRGRAVARIVPVPAGGTDLEMAALVRAGVLRAPRGPMPKHLLRPSPVKDPGGTVLKALLEEREAQRDRGDR